MILYYYLDKYIGNLNVFKNNIHVFLNYQNSFA